MFLILGSAWGTRGAFAQSEERAHGPLFGGDSASSTIRHSIDVTASIANGQDDDLGAEQGATSGSPEQSRTGGRYSNVDAVVSLVQSRPRITVVARAASSVRYYPDLNGVVGSSDRAAADVNLELNRKTTLRTSLDASYVSSVAFDTPFQASDAASSSALARSPADWTRTFYGGSTELARTTGEHSTVSVLYSLGHSQSRIADDRSDEQTVTAQLSHGLGRDTTVRIAYAFHAGLQQAADDRTSLRSHDAQVAIDRQWRHSVFRRTALSVSAGPSLFDAGAIAGRPLRVVGTAILSHDISRDWSTSLSYHRGAGVRDGVFFSDTAAADIHGRVGRRGDVSVTAGYTDGDIGATILQNRYGTSFGSARIQGALGRFMAVYGQYSLYRYDFRGAPPAGVTAVPDRRSLRVGINLWVPVQRS